MCFASEGPDPGLLLNLLGLLTVPALVVLNGLFVAAEFALVSVRRTRIEEMQKKGVAGTASVIDAIDSLDDSIAATQLGITLASIGLGFVGEPALARLIRPLFADGPAGFMTANALATIFSFALITFMHVVFGELIPKTVALQVPDRTAVWLSAPLLLFGRITRPLIWSMNGIGNFLLKKAGFQSAGHEAMVHSVEELLLLVEDQEEAGVLDSQQADLVENIFRLSGKKVGDIALPIDKVIAMSLDTPPEAALEVVRREAHSRMPVYDGTIDNIVGVVNTKDLLYLVSLGKLALLEDAMYPALFLKPDEPVGNALRLFKKAHRHMALVRDGEGKIRGLITLEDVLEEIVGDIEDEHDAMTPKLVLRRSAIRRRGGAGS